MERKQATHDLFTTAIESGSSWFQVIEYRWSTDGGTTPDLEGAYATIVDDDGETYRVDLATIKRGARGLYKDMCEHDDRYGVYLRRALADYTFSKWDEFDFDAEVADAVLQFGLYRELVYG